MIRRNISRLVLMALLLGVSASAEIIDRIVATVNGRVILQSDWDAAVCYEAFVDGRSLDQVTTADRKAALDRLIDQELLREQMRNSESRTAVEEVEKRIHDIRQHYAGAQDGAEWGAVLQRHGMTEKGLEARIATELDVMRLVDSRLRPTIQIDNRSIESYYQQTLIPQLRQSGANEVPLAEVTPKIKELLTQQKMDQLLVAWLQNLRAESEIHAPAVQPISGGAGPGGQQR